MRAEADLTELSKVSQLWLSSGEPTTSYLLAGDSLVSSDDRFSDQCFRVKIDCIKLIVPRSQIELGLSSLVDQMVLVLPWLKSSPKKSSTFASSLGTKKK